MDILEGHSLGKKERLELKKKEVQKISCAIKCFTSCADRWSLMAFDICRHGNKKKKKDNSTQKISENQSASVKKNLSTQRSLKRWGGNSSEREAAIKDGFKSQNTSPSNSVARIKK